MSIKDELVVPRPMEYLDEIDDAELVQGNFLKKQDFLTKTTVMVMGLAKSNFKGKYDLHIQVRGEPKILSVNGPTVKELKNLLGENLVRWQGKAIVLHSSEGEWEINGTRTKGYTLSVSIP